MIAIFVGISVFVGLAFYAWKYRAKLKAEEQASVKAFERWRHATPVPPAQSTKVEPKPLAIPTCSA